MERTFTKPGSRGLLPRWAFPLTCAICLAAAKEERTFDFTGGTIPAAEEVTPDTLYDAGRGFGFMDEPGDKPDAPRSFVVDLEEGNYDVSVRLGSPTQTTSTTVKAESRRLMLHEVEAAEGEFVTRTFTVNVRKPEIRTGGVTRLNSRESEPPMTPSWDEHLTLEFNGEKPGVAAVRIVPNPDATTVFLAGDSTVTDQRNEPWAGWGQMLPRFFGPGVAISNHAESGLSLRSFEYQQRLEKVLSMMKEGDYLFIQFGHNDQKDKSAGAGPFTSYKSKLKEFVEAARNKGGIPVVVTPMERRRWKGGEPQTTLADYAEAVRQVAKEEKVAVIDLHAMSLALYKALGERGSAKAFVHYPAGTYPGQDRALKDDTHHSPYGGYQLARCMVEGIRTQLPELAGQLREDAGAYDPAEPDAPGSIDIPESPVITPGAKPAGD